MSINSIKRDISSWVNSIGQGEVTEPFFDFIQSMGEAKAKQDVETIIQLQIAKLKEILKKGDLLLKGDQRVVRETLIKLIYCEMLGHKVEFGYFFVVGLTQMQNRLVDKRIAYICGSLFLRPNDEMTCLWVNCFGRDLISTNKLEIEMALSCMTCILSAEAIPSVLDLVLNLSKHESPSVKKKVVMVMKKIMEIDPTKIDLMSEYLRDALCDSDPSVMAASLNVYDLLIEKGPAAYKILIPSLISIQKQVLEKALPKDFEFNGIPSPWIQIKVIKILAKLGEGDKESSELMYELILDTLRRAEASGIQLAAANAVIYQCITAITKIVPNGVLLTKAAEVVSRFMKIKDNNNIKYLGLKCLIDIIHINPQYALEHQNEVIECLGDTDETIQRITLDVLYAMTNPANVSIVTEQLLEHLLNCTDKYFKEELVSKITLLAEKFSPDNEWFIRTMIKVFLLGGNFVNASVAFNLLVLLAEGSTGGEDEDQDNDLRIFAVESFFAIIISETLLTDLLIQVISWTLGEYAFLVDKEIEAIDAICDLFDKAQEEEVKIWFINALAKLCSHTKTYPPQVSDLVKKYQRSANVELQQRCCELAMVASSPAYFEQIMPRDASCWEIDVDPEMDFLNAWIDKAIATGVCSPAEYSNKNASLQNRLARAHPTKTPLIYKYEQPAMTSLTKLAAAQEPTSIFDAVVAQPVVQAQAAPTSLTALV